MSSRPPRLGYSVGLLLLLFYLLPLALLLRSGHSSAGLADLLGDDYFWTVLCFTLLEATLSVAFSLGLGLPLARALFYQRFPGRTALLRLLALCQVLPALVVIFALLALGGGSGWLGVNLYGLPGIVLAHVFFNLPLAARTLLGAYEQIPDSARRLAWALGIGGWARFRLLEWPLLRPALLALARLIFILCAGSFTIVLTLGGGPAAATPEVLIYQALMFENEPERAALLALLQLGCGGLLLLFGRRRDLNARAGAGGGARLRPVGRGETVLHGAIIGLSSLLLLLPLATLIGGGLQQTLQLRALDPQLPRALGWSLLIASTAATLAVLLALALLLTVRRLRANGAATRAALLLGTGLLPLLLPTLVLAAGLYLGLRGLHPGPLALFGLVVLCNGLGALPFVLRVLEAPLQRNLERQDRLCQLLNLRGWARWTIVERATLGRPLRYGWALAAALALGDFGAIAFFGSGEFTSLTKLLYSQIGHYYRNDAGLTALLLLAGCWLLFWLCGGDDESGP